MSKVVRPGTETPEQRAALREMLARFDKPTGRSFPAIKCSRPIQPPLRGGGDGDELKGWQGMLKRIWLWLSGRGVSNRRAVGEQTFDGRLPLVDNPVLARKCDKICLDCLGIESVAARDLDECTERAGCIPVQICAHLKADGRTVSRVDPNRRYRPALERRVNGDEPGRPAVKADLSHGDRHAAHVYDVDDVADISVCLYCLVKRDFCVRPMAYKVDDEVDDPKRAADDGDGQRDDVCR